MKKITSLRSLCSLLLTLAAFTLPSHRASAQCPIPAFMYSVQGTTVTFYDSSMTTGFNNLYYQWSFGDGTASSATNPVHSYNAPGTYYVCLTLSDSMLGCNGTTYCDSVTVGGIFGGCQAYYYGNQTGNHTIQFTNMSSAIAGCNFTWYFGDGDSSNQVSPAHTYATAGYYHVCLVMSNPAIPCTDTYCSWMTSDSCNANANFTYSINGNSLTVYGDSGANTLASYWYFDGANGTSGNSATFTFSNPSNHLVTHIVNGANCSDSMTQSIWLGNNLGCSAYFFMAPDSSQAHTWWAIASVGGVPPYAFVWYWGDGTSSTGSSPTHTYASAGYYNICLVITDSIGCSSTYCDSAFLSRHDGTNTMITVNVQMNFITTGVQTPGASHIDIYPNPAHSVLQLNAVNTTATQVQLCDLLGKVWINEPVYANKKSISLELLPAGVYLLRVQTSEGMLVQKFVKN